MIAVSVPNINFGINKQNNSHIDKKFSSSTEKNIKFFFAKVFFTRFQINPKITFFLN